MNKKGVIVRGIHGSGKSTVIRYLYPDAFVVSADNYFLAIENDEVAHKFFRNSGKEPHHYVDIVCMGAIHNQVPLIVVEDTNIKLWEFACVYQMLENWGYEVEVIRLDVDPNIASRRSLINSSSPEDNRRLHFRIEPFEGETVITSKELDEMICRN